MRVSVIIPVLNEEASIGRVLADLPREHVAEVIVVDGGSQDRTREVARGQGARVITEPRRGYGRACLAGMRELTYGWPTEMIAKAARQKRPIIEVPVRYRKRIGVSKVSGTVRGSVLAGYYIISTIFRNLIN